MIFYNHIQNNHPKICNFANILQNCLNYTRFEQFWHQSRQKAYTCTCNITKTCLYNIEPLKPHFYIVKLGFIGVYIIFLISAQNIDCGYSLELGSNEYPQSMFKQKFEKYQRLLSENVQFLQVEFSIYLNRCVFVMIL